MRFFDILDSDVFVGYFQNFSGFQNRKLILLKKNGIQKIFPNHQTWDRGTGGGFGNAPGGFAKFYRWDNKLYFIESFCDTLYQVTLTSLIPRYYFNTAPYKAEYSKQAKVASNTFNYSYIVAIKENKKHIFFQLWIKRDEYLGFIEKVNNNVVICKKSPSGVSGLIDDVSSLIDVVPYLFTQNNEMVYVIDPVQLIRWFKENPEKASLARIKLPWLKNIDEFSNPVIAIGKCKE